MTPKILQFGGGNFLRAFLGPAVAALNNELDYGGSIVVVKPTPGGDYRELREQDGRYHVVVRGVAGGKTVDRTEVVDVVDRVVHPYREWAAFLATAAEPALDTVVSNTTEKGIRYVKTSWVENECPVEFPSKLCRWLYARYRALGSAGGVDVLPCELIAGNGQLLREYVLRHAADWDLPVEFTNWVRDHCVFTDTLVDRIVSGQPAPDDPAWSTLTFPDAIPAVAEPYALWAIADQSGLAERFPLDKTAFNAVYTTDLERYRALKVRVLNAGHILMVVTGVPAGLMTVADYLEDPDFELWLLRTLEGEILPTLPYPKAETKVYAAAVVERFRNPFLHHKLADINRNLAEKWRVRVQPSLDWYAERGKGIPPGLARAKAAFNEMMATAAN